MTVIGESAGMWRGRGHGLFPGNTPDFEGKEENVWPKDGNSYMTKIFKKCALRQRAIKSRRMRSAGYLELMGG
jgi:hypothetical protein